jgi:hypothetical protein
MGWSFVNDICRSERRPTLTGARNSGKKKRSSSVLCASYFYEKNKAALEFQRWPGALNVPDPVAVTVDPQGRVYVSATTRRKVADQDIREHRDWIPDDVALTSVEEKEAFLKRELAPGKVRLPGGGLLDNTRTAPSTGKISPYTASVSTNCAIRPTTARRTKSRFLRKASTASSRG